MPPANAYAAYRSAEVETLSQRDLIVKLYQGAERFLLIAKTGIDNKRVDVVATNCGKAKRIFVELLSTLNFERGGEVAGQLRELYLFFISEIVEANVRKDAGKLTALLPIIATLREGWQQVPDEAANLSSLPNGNHGHSFNIRT